MNSLLRVEVTLNEKTSMKRIQAFLPERQFDFLIKESERREISLAEFLRGILGDYLDQLEEDQK